MSGLAAWGEVDDLTPATIEAIGTLPWEAVASASRRYRLALGAWLVARRLETTDGTWSEQLAGYAHDLETTPRTLGRWMARAAELAEVALPGQERAEPKRKAPEPSDSVTDDSDVEVDFPTGKPETVEQVVRLGNLVENVGAQGWAKALTVDRIDTLIGILRAARTEALRQATTTTATERGADPLDPRERLDVAVEPLPGWVRHHGR